MTRKSTFILIAATCAAILLAACGGSSDSSSSSTSEPVTSMGSSGSSGGGDAVAIKNFAYAPVDLTVSKGSTVKFSNQDSTEHTATASGGGFDTGTIREGQTKPVTLNTAGTFAYVCSFHPFMHGTITVK
jgi:plastocyanin